MPLCTKEQIQDEFVSLTLSSTSKVKDTEVDRWILEAEEEINATIGVKYLVPIDPTPSPQAALLLRTCCILMVTQRVKEKLNVKTVAEKINQDLKPIDLAERARKKLKAISVGDILLRDATLATPADGVRSCNVDEGREFIFDRDIDQW